MELKCDRCGENEAPVAIWDDGILCGRIDAICDDCYEDGHRIHRPIEPPYDEDGELYGHVVFVDCPNCDSIHEENIADNLGVCPRRSAEDAETEDIVFDINEDIIVEERSS